MDQGRASEFRRKADECRTHARLTTDANVRLQWTMLAGHLETWAQVIESERSPGKDGDE
jgi:hypothetical protein